MSKRSISIVVSGLIVISGILGFFTFESEVVSAGITIYVGSGPGNSTTSIQDAIDNYANSGDTVFVYNGTYIENLVVNKTINLTGEDKDITIIDGGGSGDAVVISADWVNMTGFTVTGGGGTQNDGGIELSNVANCYVINNNISNNDRDGIRLLNTDSSIIENNHISNSGDEGIHIESSFRIDIIGNDIFNNGLQNFLAGYGILIYNSGENNVLRNNVSGNGLGIIIDYSNGNNITGNNVSSNNGDGIRLENSNENILTSNIISDHFIGIYLTVSVGNNLTLNSLENDGIFIYGNLLEHWNTHHIDISNTVNGKPVYYRRNQTGGSIPLGAGEVILANCTDVQVNNQVLDNCSVGIEMGFSWNNNVINNNVMNCSEGIYLYSSNENIIDNNNVNLNSNGIDIQSSDFNEITNNNVYFNRFGITIQSSIFNDIKNNNLENNSNFGINARYVSNANITNNNATSNYYGIYFRDSSNINATYNIILNNYWGINIRSTTDSNVTQNNISDNEIGIQMRDSEYINISFNELYSNSEDGIYITGDSTHNMVIGNKISDGNDGIAIFPRFFWRPNQNYIVGNIISNAQIGIHLYYVPTNTLLNNTMFSCGIVIEGDQLSYWNAHHIDTDNTVNGKPIYYLKNQTAGIVPLGAGEVILANCTNVIILIQELTDGSVGIELGFSSNNIINSNNISSNKWAGIYSWDSDGNEIIGNTISSNDQYGIWLQSSSNLNNITNNYISNGDNGIYLLDSNENNMTGNNISYNDYGMYLNVSMNNNIIANSIFSNNVYGIYLLESINNDIYHNNIIDNLNQAYDDSNESNIWNLTYSGGGNYWSDFSPTCPDLYSGAITPQTIGSPDGICDFQYDIDANSTDYYPLKNLWDPSNTPPSVTINLTANGGVTFVNITWNPPISDGGLPITHYRIYRGNISGGEIFYVEIGDILYYNDTNVIGGNTYYYYVSAVNILGEGPFSNEDNATALAFPDAPFNLTSSSGDSYVNLNWEAPSFDGGFQITNYTIYRGDTSGGETFLIEIGNVTFYNDTVTNGKTYYYYVRAKNVVGEGPFSNEVNATPGAIPDVPLDLNTTAGDFYINITWTIPVSDGGFPITNYIIYRGTTSGATTFLEEIGNVTYYNDTNVMNGVTYYYIVSAKNVIGEGPLSDETNATPLGPPFGPQNLQASPGDSYVYLSWVAPMFDGGSPVTSYRIYRGPMSDAETFLVEIGNLTSYNDATVTNGVIYFYKVKAVNSVGEGQFSNEASATPAAIPGAPTGLSATPYDSYVRLTWITPASNGGSPITNYIIYRGTTSGTLTYLAEIGVTLSYDDFTVSSGITYYYKVTAKNAVGEGPLSNEANAIILGIPSSPQNPQASAGDSYVNISWEAPAFNGGSSITDYIIYRDTTSGGETFLIEIGNVLYYNDTSITNGITYYYKVSAKNTVGEGFLSDEVTGTPIGSPTAPQNLQALPGDSFVNITWDTPTSDGGSPVLKYRIYRGTISGGETYLIELGDVLYYNDTSITNGVTYYYKVSTKNAVGEGPLSDEVTGTPIGSPTAPQNPQALPGDSFVNITWDTPTSDGGSPIIKYRIYRGTTSGGETFLIEVDVISYYMDTGVTNGIAYYYRVSAVNAIGEGLLSNEVNAIPNGDSDDDSYLDHEEQDMTLIWILLLLIIIVVIIVLVMLIRKRGGKAKEMPAFEKELPPPPGEIKETVPEGEETGSAEWEEEPKGEIEEEIKSEEGAAEKESESEEDILQPEDIEEEKSP